jgi:glycosyltransferase involved in cell wall biosynthesis
LRILVVNWLDRENPAAGGAEIHLHETFGRLVERGHSVTLLASGWRDSPARAVLDGIEVHRTGGRHTFSIAAPRYYKAKLSAESFSVVIEDLNKVPLFTRTWTKAPVVLLVHHLFGLTAFREASPPIAAATWLLERPLPVAFRGTPVVAVSESTADDLARRGFSPERIRVIPNGVDIDHFTPPDSPGERYPDPSLLYLGRLKRYKRIDLVLRAMARLRERGVFCRFRIAGKGDHRAKLEALVGRLGLADRVDFLGFVTEEEKLELLRRSWIHVLTSPREGWGISNLEAAACGTPTIASDSPGLRDSVRHGETGLLTPHGDVAALSDGIARLISGTEERRSMEKRARAFAEGFSWDETTRGMEDFLLRAVSPG